MRTVTEPIDNDIDMRPDPWSERVKHLHGLEWANDWQYGVVWRMVPHPGGGVRPEFEPFGPDGLPGDGWELNVDRGDRGTETRSPSQPEMLMQLTHWRRRSPGMTPTSAAHKVSRQYRGSGE